MILDKPVHKDALIHIIQQSTFNGINVEIIYELLQSIRNAKISEDTVMDSKNPIHNASDISD